MYPPLNTEVAVATVNIPVTTGLQVKIDYAVSVEVITTSNWAMSFEVRLYRDTTLITTKTFIDSAASAGTHRFSISNTQVDTSVSTETTGYQLRIIFTTATNVATGTALNRNINAIVFP